MRFPAVSGSFYSSSSSALKAEVRGYLEAAGQEVKKKEQLAIVCPHAGYMYSGRCAAYSFAACSNWKEKEITAVVIGPNHTGLGMPISVSFEDWKTPLGEVKCDVELAGAIVKAGKIAQRDELAHFREHSCEVQLPFLQEACPHAKFVAVCMGIQDLAPAQELGRAIFEAIKKTRKNAIVIASSDFTHYESAESAKKKDMLAIERLLKLDEAGFESLVEERGLSICGHGPIAAAMHYSKLAGAKKCELLKYTNSGEASGDYYQVVAYASLAISK
ncbi:MAG: MEMO1 family protein [Candidatus Micrarchaeota archaeon]|nr:MEMO1 family protein [Candidatus Micrarchaeota archaeon]